MRRATLHRLAESSNYMNGKCFLLTVPEKQIIYNPIGKWSASKKHDKALAIQAL